MNFWDFLIIFIVVLGISNIVIGFLNYRLRMALIKNGKQLDGKKIAEATKSHLS